MLNTNNTVMLRGLSGHGVETIGSCELMFPDLKIYHQFQVMPKDFHFSDTRIHGILGEDFLSRTDAVLNFNTYFF